MSRVIHDLRCDDPGCGHFMPDVLCQRGQSKPPCTRCGGPTHTSWARGRAPQYQSFAPRDHGGGVVVSSPTEEAQLVARIRRRFPRVKEVHFEPDSPAQQKRRAEEARHFAWQERKDRGIGEELPREQKAARGAAAKEASKTALKDNRDPKAAASQAAASVPSAAALAGAVR